MNGIKFVFIQYQSRASSHASKKCLLALKILLLKLHERVRLIVLVTASKMENRNILLAKLASVLCCHASNNAYSRVSIFTCKC